MDLRNRRRWRARHGTDRSFFLSLWFHVCAGVLLVFFTPGLTAENLGEIGGHAARSVAPGALESSVLVSSDLAGSFFDDEGALTSLADTASGPWWSLSYGLELTYGFSPAVGARLSWLPGFTFPSRYSGDEKRRRNGASNLRLEVPTVLLGGLETGGAAGESARAAAETPAGLLGTAPVEVTVAPVGIIKIRGYDLEAQADRRQAGETYIAEHPDRKAHALGVAFGERLPVGRRTTLTAGQEVLLYFPADYAEQSLANYDLNLVRAGLEDAEPYDTIYYRYRLSGSLGATHLLQEAPRTRWRAGLDLDGHFMPAPIVDDILVENTDSFLFSATPSISVAPRVWNHRTSLELSWSIPLFGKNEDAVHEVAFAIRTTLLSGTSDDDAPDSDVPSE